MKYIFLTCALLLTCGCATEPDFFLRDSEGNLTGPIPLKTGSLVELGYSSYKIDKPRPGEMELISRLRTTVLPSISFSNTPLAEVEQTLYSLQRQTIGNKAIPVYFALRTLAPQTNAVSTVMDADGLSFDHFSSTVDTSSGGISVTFSARYISLWETVQILSSLTGLKYLDIRNGTVSLRPTLPTDGLPEVDKVSDPVDAEVAHQFQQEVDGVSCMLAGLKTPEHLSLGKSDERRFADEFDAMSFFDAFTNISMQETYVLDYVQTQWGMGSSPVLYARKASVKPFARPSELQARNDALQSNAINAAASMFDRWRETVLSAKAREASETAMLALCRQVTQITLDGAGDEYLSHVFVPNRSIAYLEYVALHLLGEQFYLGWHAGYNDTRIICTQSALEKVLRTPDMAKRLVESDRFILASIDPTPSVRRHGDEVRLTVVTFSKWGGLTRRGFTITQTFPHQMTSGADDVLWHYDCGSNY